MHIDTVIDEQTPVDDLRQASITRRENRAVGVPLFVSGEELERQGIDLEVVEKIAIRVEDGFLLLVPVDQ